jgi:hypothetical protein
MAEKTTIPVPVRILHAATAQQAHSNLIVFTEARLGADCRQIPDSLRDLTIEPYARRSMIKLFANDLMNHGAEWAGALAIAWRMLACNPADPGSFHSFMPQLAWMMDHTVFFSAADAMAARARLDIWWRAAVGEFQDRTESIFEIVDAHLLIQTDGQTYSGDGSDDGAAQQFPTRSRSPSVVVMRGRNAEQRGLPTAWRNLRDKKLPLVVANDVARIRDTLHREFPHALQTVNLMTRDLREGQPVRLQPMLLLGQPGSGKSRLVRRLADLLEIYTYRYDGAASHDGTYAGTAKSWATAQPSAPARAVMMSMTANPILMVDEIDKAGSGTYNGSLWNAMVPFLERETAARYRESGIDAELDLSHVNHISTANSTAPLPGPLRDRFRVVRMPSPDLVHLPALAAQVMKDLAADDEARAYDEPLGEDELAVIGRLWVREKFSMRKLQRMIEATLEARDSCARRH